MPAPELAKLDYFVGDWTTEGSILPGPWGAGGKFSWTEHTQWMTGHFFLVGRWDFQMPAHLGGDGEELFVIGYDTRHSVYTFDAFSSQGLHQISQGRLTGDSWLWTSEGLQQGQPVQQRMTMQVLSPTTYNLRFEISNDGTIWKTFMEGKAVKK
ncbi:MAG TPA: DUF1579 family protein [Terriglobales bacterium]|nr:DUF1579 family protein [Terriglobales bacterium]